MDYCIISQLNYTNPKKMFMYILMLLSMQKQNTFTVPDAHKPSNIFYKYVCKFFILAYICN